MTGIGTVESLYLEHETRSREHLWAFYLDLISRVRVLKNFAWIKFRE